MHTERQFEQYWSVDQIGEKQQSSKLRGDDEQQQQRQQQKRMKKKKRLRILSMTRSLRLGSIDCLAPNLPLRELVGYHRSLARAELLLQAERRVGSSIQGRHSENKNDATNLATINTCFRCTSEFTNKQSPERSKLFLNNPK